MRKYKKIILISLSALLLVGGIGGYFIYGWIFKSNVFLDGKKSVVIFIPTGSDYNSVVEILGEQGIIRDMKSFEWVAKEKKYSANVKPGRYRILAKMSNDELINMLRSGNQEPSGYFERFVPWLPLVRARHDFCFEQSGFQAALVYCSTVEPLYSNDTYISIF